MRIPELTDKLAVYGLRYTAVFVPQSASRNSAEKNPSLNWRIHLSRAGNAANIATDYMQGIAHVPGYIHTYGSRPIMTDDTIKSQERAAETGNYPLVYKTGTCYAEKIGGRIKLPAPPLADILHSLLLDGDAAEYTFDEWASNYGYDTDSRKAEATYNACRETGRQLRRMFSQSELAELQTLFQDY